MGKLERERNKGVVGAEGREKLRSWREAGKNSSSSEGKILRGANLHSDVRRINLPQ